MPHITTIERTYFTHTWIFFRHVCSFNNALRTKLQCTVTDKWTERNSSLRHKDSIQKRFHFLHFFNSMIHLKLQTSLPIYGFTFRNAAWLLIFFRIYQRLCIYMASTVLHCTELCWLQTLTFNKIAQPRVPKVLQ